MNYEITYEMITATLLIPIVYFLWQIHERLSAFVRFNSAWLTYWEKDDYNIFDASRHMVNTLNEISLHTYNQSELMEKWLNGDKLRS